MYVAVNTDEMKMVCTGEYRQLCAYMLVHFPDACYGIFPADDEASFTQFTDMELKMLYRNTFGNDFVGSNFAKACLEMAVTVPECPVPLEKLEPKAEVIEAKERAASPITPQKPAVKPSQKPVKPVSSSAAPIARPKAGSTTGKVWDIADRLFNEAGEGVDWKEIRSKIIAACEAEGINAATAQVQFGKWKSTKI